MIVVNRTTSPVTVNGRSKVIVTRDPRGPQGKDGQRGLPGEGVNIDPGDQFILALENAMV